MSITIANRADGQLILESPGGQVMLDFTETTETVIAPAQEQPQQPPQPQDPQQPQQPQQPTRSGDEPAPPKPIILGPLPAPPLPMSIIKVKHSALVWSVITAGLPLLRLDRIIESGELNSETKAELAARANRLQPGEPLSVDAHLPTGHAIDAELLAGHLSQIAKVMGHPIVMSLWTKVLGE
ncbi:hypothetical protein A6V36_13005 [Paraburkholderia ginsengiterrae]|uniref:Uncharacterized protein n=1 Tax=Paraburkholderia ginsengiterrae TaxID=1462993 RepID=A0A1A9N3N5_9BURK|nr:hypothetical protein [Paraburkholderia ginsengiterrae]OAJ53253.1 hypothetical protein A6V36_13005 [Paraburkholderia ginsengiterrae]OAJ56716.1 hypothetical protein A6V37_31330 [Paraburkholderia ginsengiterrae]